MSIYKENNKYKLFTEFILKTNKRTINIQDYYL